MLLQHLSRKPIKAHILPQVSSLLTLVCTSLLLSATTLHAQTVYRIVGPDGRVTFSDKPAVSPSNKVTAVEKAEPAATSSTATLPFELRQVVGKYPVTLYSGNNCAPCDSGRNMLTGRGVPFTEKTVTTAQDAEALKSLSGATALPFMTIGSQHLSGYSSTEWTQYLDAAGYPAQSKLPASYRASVATPLAALPIPAAVEKPVPTVPASSPAVIPAAPKSNPNNPAGIQF